MADDNKYTKYSRGTNGPSSAVNVPLIVTLSIIGALVLSMVVVTSITLWNAQQTNDRLNTVLPPTALLVGSCPTAESRRQQAYVTRANVAFGQYARSVPCQVNNGDEQSFPTFIGQFTKGMLHDSLGIVSPSYYNSLLTAVSNPAPSNFAAILRAPNATFKFVNPQASLATDLVGSNSLALIVPPAPKFNSAEQAGEYIENAWMSICRDVPFDQYGLEPLTIAAINELNTVTDFKGPLPVTAANLFRGKYSNTGPYISQFMYLNVSYGVNQLSQKIDCPIAGVNFMTDWGEFLRVQNGETPAASLTFNGTARYLICGRDISHYVHYDMLFQAYHTAAMILLGLNAPYNPSNPYVLSANQVGFGTFGGPMVSTFVTEIGTRCLHGAWASKWLVHRRLRPEAYAGFVDRTKKGFATFPVHSQALNSNAATYLNTTYNSYLLPQAFPEGSPLHPSYPAGHATVGACCVTILKALFDGSWNIPSPVQPDSTGLNLIPYVGSLTVEHELNKLATNIGIGRNIAGVHWRSDLQESQLFGEQIAIATLRDYKNTFNEGSITWQFKAFDGTVLYV